jgi:hypothetical protein
MFVIAGSAGVLLAVVWWSIHRDPSEVRLTPNEIRYLTEHFAPAVTTDRIRSENGDQTSLKTCS